MTQRFELDRKIYFEALEQIQKTIVSIVLEEGRIPESVVEPMNEQWVDVINRNYEDLFTQVYERINKYLNFYNVQPHKQSDEFKYFYFSGMVIADKLNNEGMVEHAKYHLRAILKILDYRLESPYKAKRPQLSERIEKAIENREIEKHFGEYGWYMIYKCLFNSAHDNYLQSQNDHQG